jgi:hypothetical protein
VIGYGDPDGWIDIGSNVHIHFTQDEAHGEYGLWECHADPNGQPCSGNVFFRGVLPTAEPSWIVEKREPLTLSPSIQCRACGHHGFIREGRWVPA